MTNRRTLTCLSHLIIAHFPSLVTAATNQGLCRNLYLWVDLLRESTESIFTRGQTWKVLELLLYHQRNLALVRFHGGYPFIIGDFEWRPLTFKFILELYLGESLIHIFSMFAQKLRAGSMECVRLGCHGFALERGAAKFTSSVVALLHALLHHLSYFRRCCLRLLHC